MTRDCSVTESWGDPLTLFRDNYPKEGQDPCVGFAIDEPRGLCEQQGFSMDPVDLTQVLDRIDHDWLELSAFVAQARKCLAQLETKTVSLA
jgi:hypothetical protein